MKRITEAIQDSMFLETKAISQEVFAQIIILGSTNLTINNKIHLLVTMVIDSLNPTNRPSLSKTHIQKRNQILNNNYHNSSNSYNKALVSMHQTEITLFNRDN